MKLNRDRFVLLNTTLNGWKNELMGAYSKMGNLIGVIKQTTNSIRGVYDMEADATPDQIGSQILEINARFAEIQTIIKEINGLDIAALKTAMAAKSKADYSAYTGHNAPNDKWSILDIKGWMDAQETPIEYTAEDTKVELLTKITVALIAAREAEQEA